MWRSFLLTVVLCLVCLLRIAAQTNLNLLNEAETQVVLQKNSADFSLVVENPQRDFNGKFELGLLDKENKVRAQTAASQIYD